MYIVIVTCFKYLYVTMIDYKKSNKTVLPKCLRCGQLKGVSQNDVIQFFAPWIPPSNIDFVCLCASLGRQVERWGGCWQGNKYLILNSC